MILHNKYIHIFHTSKHTYMEDVLYNVYINKSPLYVRNTKKKETNFDIHCVWKIQVFLLSFFPSFPFLKKCGYFRINRKRKDLKCYSLSKYCISDQFEYCY